MDFATMSTVAEVTVRATPNEVHVRTSLHGQLLLPSKKSLCRPLENHFFCGFSKNAGTVKP
jgi:hypothetical protein